MIAKTFDNFCGGGRPERLAPSKAGSLAQAAVLLSRFGRPAELARLVTFVAIDDAAFLTGTVIPLDGGGQQKGSHED